MSEVTTFKFSKHKSLIEMVKRVRNGEQSVVMPKIGSEWDGLPVLRVSKTVDPNWYLAVLEENIMFYLEDDINVLS